MSIDIVKRSIVPFEQGAAVQVNVDEVEQWVYVPRRLLLHPHSTPADHRMTSEKLLQAALGTFTDAITSSFRTGPAGPAGTTVTLD